jgi:hypothetical protein
MIIHHHLGLGDHIICNGLIRTIAAKENIKLFCKHKNYQNVSYMYKDNSNIQILCVENDNEATDIGLQNSNYIRLGISLNSNFPSNLMWDEVFYYQIGLPYELSWNNFFINKPKSQNPVPNEPYGFLCHMGSDGIDRLDYTKIDHTLQKNYSNNGNFFDNIDLIQNATEIHCINSSYIHLIDRIETSKKTKLVYHKNFIRKNHSNFILKKDWIVV